MYVRGVYGDPHLVIKKERLSDPLIIIFCEIEVLGWPLNPLGLGSAHSTLALVASMRNIYICIYVCVKERERERNN